MIFGFNTDIKSSNTIYHVQSEAREHERLLQTQIFVRGHCIGKKASSYADLISHPEFSEARMHEMLKSQHRDTVESLRAGQIDEALTRVRPLHEVLSEMCGIQIPAANPAPVTAVLSLEFLNSAPVLAGETLQLRFRVLAGDKPVNGAKLISKVTSANNGQENHPLFAQAETEPDGCGEVKLPLSLQGVTEATVLVQATHQGRTATKKFRLTK
ncbi:MAG: hypothetical protein ROO76_18470 [Terriglobia bacterium]|nr:hypothetical protein [Terriglobia bacterium]